MELDALLGELSALRDDGNATRFDQDSRYRWVLHRLWIAVGNEALAYTAATGQPVRADRTWSNLYDLRNHLAHSRLPDIDEGPQQADDLHRRGRDWPRPVDLISQSWRAVNDITHGDEAAWDAYRATVKRSRLTGRIRTRTPELALSVKIFSTPASSDKNSPA